MEGVFVPAGCEHRMSWAEEQRPFAAAIGIGIAAAADECHELLEMCCGERYSPMSFNPDDIRAWLRLYSRHRDVAAGVAGIFNEVLPKLLLLERVEGTGLMLGELSKAGAIDLLDNSMWIRAFSRIEVRFFFRISMPCWLMNGVDPGRLLRRIGFGHPREGESVENLVKLDSLVVQHPRFGRYLNCGDHKERQQRAAMIGECMGKPLQARSKRNLKYLLAALISRTSELLGSRLGEPQIRGLFDAIAKDRGVGHRDGDLPESPETFAKAIQRHRPFWRIPEMADEETLEAVRALEALLS